MEFFHWWLWRNIQTNSYSICCKLTVLAHQIFKGDVVIFIKELAIVSLAIRLERMSENLQNYWFYEFFFLLKAIWDHTFEEIVKNFGQKSLRNAVFV